MDLRSLLPDVRRSWRFIVLMVAVGIAAGYHSMPTTRAYTASSLVYVGSPTSEWGAVDLRTAGAYDVAMATYADLLRRDVFVDEALAGAPSDVDLDDRDDRDELVAGISVGQILGTQLLGIEVRHEEPDTARWMANRFADTFVQRVSADGAADQGAPGEGDLPRLPAYVFDDATIPTVPGQQSSLSTLMRGALVGLAVSLATLTLVRFFDLTVRRAEDLETHTGLAVLAAVPHVPDRGTELP